MLSSLTLADVLFCLVSGSLALLLVFSLPVPVIAAEDASAIVAVMLVFCLVGGTAALLGLLGSMVVFSLVRQALYNNCAIANAQDRRLVGTLIFGSNAARLVGDMMGNYPKEVSLSRHIATLLHHIATLCVTS